LFVHGSAGCSCGWDPKSSFGGACWATEFTEFRDSLFELKNSKPTTLALL
jgi:hypothetical protein